MANDSGGMGFIGFILGGVVVAVAILAFVIYGGQGTGPSKTVNIDKTVNIELPKPSAPR